MSQEIDWMNPKGQHYFNMDCMEGMKMMPDKCMDLAIVDPPYGDLCNLKGGTSHKGGSGWKGNMKQTKWNILPTSHYWRELKRVSKNQIVWGGNYFTDNLPPSQGWIIWDKGQRDFTLADGEMAWTSFARALRIFDFSRAESTLSLKGINHATAKPIALYRWLLKNYAKEGMKLLDTHVGSASSLVAFEEFGFDYVAFEKDEDYYKASVARLENHRKQHSLFSGEDIFKASGGQIELF